MNIEIWQIHALLMAIGTSILIYVALLPSFFRGKKNWFRIHKRLGLVGGITIILGLITAIYMVTTGIGIHFRVIHSYLGIFTVLCSFSDIVIGYLAINRRIRILRIVHLWLGRASFLLLIITVIMGVSIVL